MKYFDICLYLSVGGFSLYNLSKTTANPFDLLMLGATCFFAGMKLFFYLEKIKK